MGTWAEQLHPRNPTGAGGGEFKSGGGNASSKPAGQAKSKAPRSSGGGGLSYNGRTGTGYGMKHGDPRVKKLQQALNRLGIRDAHGKPLQLDGKLGPLTTQAIKAWQRKNGMKPTGAVSSADLAKLSTRTHKKTALTRKKKLAASRSMVMK